MASLVDIARAMEKDKEKNSPQQATISAPAASKPTLSLVDIAKDQQVQSNAAAPAKPLTLMDVARTAEKDVAPPVSLQNLAAEINQEERQKMDTAITQVATEVKHEQAQQRATVLKAAATEVRREIGEHDVKASRQPPPTKDNKDPPKVKSATPPRSSTTPDLVPVAYVETEDDGGYSSFEDDAKETKTKKASASTKKPAKTRAKERDAHERDSNQSESGASGDVQKTTPSELPHAKEFLRAIYRGDSRRVRDMMRDDEMDANTADQHGWSALHWAASQGQTEILGYLLDSKTAHVNAVEHMSGWTALHVAVTRDTVVCVKKLLAAGADLHVRDYYGDTVYDILKAIKGKKKERLLQLLDTYRHAR